MTHKKIRIPRESANEVMRALGTLENAIEFEDLTKDDLEAKKNFSEMIKRCDEAKKKYSTSQKYVMISTLNLNTMIILKIIVKI